MKLNRERLTKYPRVFLALYLLVGGWWLFPGHGLIDRGGKNIGVDFVTFWSASAVSQRGQPELAWDVHRMHPIQQEAVGAEIPAYAFHYPPTYLLLLLPLAFTPYLMAFVLWVVAGICAFCVVIRRIAPDPATLGLAAASPAVFQNVFQGQNGLFTTALLGGGLLMLDTRPAWAGVLFGLLTCKPQLIPVLLVALVASRRWRALGAGVTTALGLAGASLWILGPASWRAFMDNLPFAVGMLESPGVYPWARMPTVQATAMLAGSTPHSARVLQLVVSVLATAAAAAVWARGASLPSRVGALVGAAFLTTPFAFDYDTALYALPVAWLGIVGARTGFRSGEIVVLAFAWVAPMALPVIAGWTSVQLGPVLSATLLIAAWRRG